MNGVHDLGGMHGFGPVQREENEPVFHAPWERSVFASMLATTGQRLFNIDEFRHGIERMEPARYLAASYYERWLHSVETNLIEKGILGREELEERLALLRDNPEAALPRREDPQLRETMLAFIRRQPPPRPLEPARFKVGDAVVTRNIHPTGHTRLPRYARGKRGVIHALHGVATFPDTHAHGLGRQPQMLYSVCFTGRELWGESAELNQRVYLDLWESYLEPAS